MALARRGRRRGRVDAATAEAAKLIPPLDGSAATIVAARCLGHAGSGSSGLDAFAKLVLKFVEALRPQRDAMPGFGSGKWRPAEARALSHLGRVAEARRVWAAFWPSA